MPQVSGHVWGNSPCVASIVLRHKQLLIRVASILTPNPFGKCKLPVKIDKSRLNRVTIN
jgi:hypothetical protein